MKLKVTSKEIKNRYGFNNTIKLYDGDGQYLFPEYDANAYNCGVYGWNYDVFFISSYAITRGYRNTFGREADSDIVKKYDDMACELRKQIYTSIDNKTYREKLADLQHEFLAEINK